MLTDAADAFRLGLWGDLAFIGDPAVVKEENEVHVQRAALVQLQRDQRQNKVSRPPPHRPPRNGRLQSMLGQDAPGAHQASPSASGLYCPRLLPLRLLPDAHLIYRSTSCSILCLYRVTQMPAISFTVQCLFPCVKSAAHFVRWSARHRT